MHAYCLFCQTQKTDQIAALINTTTDIKTLSPRITQRYWKAGRPEERIHAYLPGYLFLFTEEPIGDFRNLMHFEGVIRRLGESENHYELTGSDRAFAMMLYNMEGTLGILKTYQEGDIVKIDDSLYRGFQGEIKKLDRRKGRAQIQFTFDGQVQTVWVGVDLLRKQSEI